MSTNVKCILCDPIHYFAVHILHINNNNIYWALVRWWCFYMLLDDMMVGNEIEGKKNNNWGKKLFISPYQDTAKQFLDVPFEVLKTPFIYIFRTKSLITVQSVKYFFYIPDRKIFVAPHFKSSCFVVVHKKRKKKSVFV